MMMMMMMMMIAIGFIFMPRKGNELPYTYICEIYFRELILSASEITCPLSKSFFE